MNSSDMACGACGSAHRCCTDCPAAPHDLVWRLAARARQGTQGACKRA
jgi:hypothetical protein